MKNPDESAVEALQQRILEERERLHARLRELDEEGTAVQALRGKRRTGRLYEVFKALSD